MNQYMDEDDLQEIYDDFLETYKPEHYEVTPENRELIKAMDPKFVWTAHSTCDNEFIAPGFLEFSPSSCCWAEHEWLVSDKAWESDDPSQWIQTSISLNCFLCNPGDDDDVTEGNPECTTCNGDVLYTYYTD
jgi:hypothetical protein